jgi:uncharacterized protein YndB with AHSA1/START domain
MLVPVLLVIVLLIGLLLLIVSRKPDTFRIERSAGMEAAPETVFALVNDFHRWEGWSPWEGIDATMQKKFSGPPSGTGAVYEWEGSKKVGKGRMEMTESVAPQRIVIKLDFLKPFEAHNITEITFAAADDITVVTWAMFGPQPFISKLFTLFMNMDKMVGKDFEKGLASLKLLSEG